MAKKVVNLGTASLLGKDGDSNRVANTKLQSNDNELYDALGADSEGNLPTALPIVKGGTGTTTLAELKQNLGIDKVNNTADKDKPVSTATQTALNKKANTDEINLTVTELSQSISLALSGKEPSLNQGTDQEYYRGDKTWQILNKNAVGLDQVDNTADIDKPISTAVQEELDKKVGTDAIIAIEQGGTGATTLEAAKQNLEIDQVDNTSDAEKPISVATQQALDAKYDKADLQASFDAKVNKTDVIAIAKGGTGATTAAAARTALGLGDAATRGTTGGNLLMHEGAYGFGGTSPGLTMNDFFWQASTAQLQRTQMINSNNDGTIGYGAGLYWKNGGFGHALMGSLLNGNLYHCVVSPISAVPASRVTTKGLVRTAANTTVDSNGFLKNASPIVELYADKFELNDEAKLQDITFEKLGIGDYLIKNSSGFAQEGWYVEQPKDSNGNIYHAVEYGTHDNGDVWVKTYEQMMDGTRIVADQNKPVDIKENRFISIRLNELPQDTTAPQNPNVVDNEGNPAPSRLHELEEGVWVISDENAAILEQERLSAMPALKRRQFRLTLAMNGYDLKEIETLIDQIDDPMQRTIAQIEWQDATDFERTNPTLLKMAELMQLTTAQVNQLWAFGLSL